MAWYNTAFKALKGVLGFAKEAAPVAAEVAAMTGHGDVVDDINKAGAAAGLADKVVDNATRRSE